MDEPARTLTSMLRCGCLSLRGRIVGSQQWRTHVGLLVARPRLRTCGGAPTSRTAAVTSSQLSPVPPLGTRLGQQLLPALCFPHALDQRFQSLTIDDSCYRGLRCSIGNAERLRAHEEQDPLRLLGHAFGL